jgi:hypothetical protein
MPAIAVPLIVAAASAGTGVYAAKKQANAAAAAQSSADQQAAFANRLALSQEDRSKQLFNTGFPAAQKTAGFYSTLLSGNRGAMSNATAAPRAAINEQFRGAAAGLDRSGLRGGARDTAMAELSRDRAGRVAGLTSGVQPAAAEALGNLGTSLMAGSGTAASGAGGLFSNLAGLSQQRAFYQDQQANESYRNLGSIFFNLLQNQQWGKPGTPPFVGTTTANPGTSSPYLGWGAGSY